MFHLISPTPWLCLLRFPEERDTEDISSVRTYVYRLGVAPAIDFTLTLIARLIVQLSQALLPGVAILHRRGCDASQHSATKLTYQRKGT